MKNAIQSSTKGGRPGGPWYAVDGNRTFVHWSCSKTHIQKRPWWKVDLAANYIIEEIVIINQKACQECGKWCLRVLCASFKERI